MLQKVLYIVYQIEDVLCSFVFAGRWARCTRV